VAVHLKGPLEVVDILAGTDSMAAPVKPKQHLYNPQGRSQNIKEAVSHGITLREMLPRKDHSA
jgi:hypothetical protein